MELNESQWDTALLSHRIRKRPITHVGPVVKWLTSQNGAHNVMSRLFNHLYEKEVPRHSSNCSSRGLSSGEMVQGIGEIDGDT